MRVSSLRSVLCVGVFAVAAVGTLFLGARALDHAQVRTPAVGINVVQVLFEHLEGIRTAGAEPGPPLLAFLGDSVSISVRGGAPTVPRALRRELGDDFRLHLLAALGAGPFDYYFLADEIAAAHPDHVVIAFSLQSLGDFFRSLSRQRMSGWVAPARLPRVLFAPTHWIGLNADDLLMNVAIVQASGVDAWRWLLTEQARLGVARGDLSDWLGDAVGRKGPQMFDMARFGHRRLQTRLDDPDRDRYRADAEWRHYGAVLSGLDEGHPVMSVLADTLGVFRRAGIRSLVYVNPINVEHLAAVGVLEKARLEGSLEMLESVVRAEGGDFLDLHALLPDAAFRDATGHLGPPAAADGPDQIAAAVAAHLRRGAFRTESR